MHWVGLLQCITCPAAVTLVLRFVFGYTLRERRLPFWVALCTAAAAGCGVQYFYLLDPETAALFSEALILVCAAAFPYTLLRHRHKRTFLLFGLAYCATADYIVTIIPVRHTEVVYILLDILMCALAVYAGLSRRTAPADFLEQIPVWIYITVFAADLSEFYSGKLRVDASYFSGVSAALKLLSLALVIGSVILVVRRYLAMQHAEQAAVEQLAVQLRHYEDLVEKNRRIRALRHDYENNLLSLGALLDADQADEARAYVRKLQSDVHAAAYTYSTGNFLSDAILSDKASAAKEKGIQISFSGTVPEKGIANPDVCTILCNLLDNAIRASTAGQVELDGRETEDRWLLTVKNPVAQKVVIRGGTIRTSKADKENHGLGIANVRRAAEKYNGYLELDCTDSCFTAEVGLMLNTEDTK